MRLAVIRGICALACAIAFHAALVTGAVRLGWLSPDDTTLPELDLTSVDLSFSDTPDAPRRLRRRQRRMPPSHHRSNFRRIRRLPSSPVLRNHAPPTCALRCPNRLSPSLNRPPNLHQAKNPTRRKRPLRQNHNSHPRQLQPHQPHPRHALQRTSRLRPVAASSQSIPKERASAAKKATSPSNWTSPQTAWWTACVSSRPAVLRNWSRPQSKP